MPYKGLFWGGHGYAWTELESAETFDSVDTARAALVDRYYNRSGSFPCVGDEAIIYLYIARDNGEARFDYPSFRVSITVNDDGEAEAIAELV